MASNVLDTAPQAWVLVTGNKWEGREVDQICGSKAEAYREAKDLRDMGCEVVVKPFTTWAEAEAFADTVRGA